ncbi:NAD(P)-binding protein [Marasmius fiardii PR-910]|nr:NAD(P)-binding protein [Marasmius fiardii PR-910]
MSPIRNARVVLKERPGPNDYPEPGKHVVYDSTPTIDVDNVPLNGGFLIKPLYFSIDPAIRIRIGQQSIFSPHRIYNFGIGVVLRSEHPEVKPGDHIEGSFNLEEYIIRKELKGLQVYQNLNRIDNVHNLPWSVFVGVLGMPGKTSYYGWKEFARAKAGEVVYVSTGAGTVVIQLAKRDGLKVIASAGSEEKTTKTSEVLEKEGPIDIYWDNVGGEMLDSALIASRHKARIIICGAISGYNTGGEPVRNLVQIIYKGVTIYGLYVFEHDHKYREEFYKVMPELVAKGEIKYTEEVTVGLEKAGEVILAQQKGLNKAKSVVKVAN